MKNRYFITALLIASFILPCTKSFAMENQENQLVFVEGLPRDVIRIICLYADCQTTKILMCTCQKIYNIILPELKYQYKLYVALKRRDKPRIANFLQHPYINNDTVVRSKKIKDYLNPSEKVPTIYNVGFCLINLYMSNSGLCYPCNIITQFDIFH